MINICWNIWKIANLFFTAYIIFYYIINIIVDISTIICYTATEIKEGGKMEAERFEQFNTLISGIYRDIQKIKAKWTEPLGMKSVHIFWVYLLTYTIFKQINQLLCHRLSAHILLSYDFYLQIVKFLFLKNLYKKIYTHHFLIFAYDVYICFLSFSIFKYPNMDICD